MHLYYYTLIKIHTSTDGTLKPTTSSHCLKDGVFLSFGVSNRNGLICLLFNCTENSLTSLPWSSIKIRYKYINYI